MKFDYTFEEWRDVPGYLGYYMVSNFGRVKSLCYGKERILKPLKVGKGYLQVILFKDGKHKSFYIHRLVALVFLPNPDNLTIINHKDENPLNNCVDNLEWCTQKYNVNYGTGMIRRVSIKNGKPVAQYTLDGTLIGLYPSTYDAAKKNGYSNGNICSCCNGGYFDKSRGKWINFKTYKGYKWKWADC